MKNKIEQKVYQDLHAKEAYLQQIEADNINATEYITGKKSGVFAYLSSPAGTTVTTAGTYYAISGTFTNNPIENFTLVETPAIRYDGEKTQCFEIDWHATIKADKAETTHVGIKINGTLEESSVMALYTKVADEEYAFSGTVVVDLQQNDEVQLVVTSDFDNTVITFEHFTTSISEFFD